MHSFRKSMWIWGWLIPYQQTRHSQQESGHMCKWSTKSSNNTKKRKRTELTLHADPEGFELYAEAVVGPVTRVD